MLIRVHRDSLPFFEALASDVRIKVMQLLAQQDMNIKELAQAVGISSSIMLKHVRKLEDAGIVLTRMISRNGSLHKLCTLLNAEYRIELPLRQMHLRNYHETHIPVGHYTNVEAHPTCGLVSEKEVIGFLDDPRIFFEPERVNAEAIWFASGFVEYSIPNRLTNGQKPQEIEISFEIASEAPGFNDEWPSDITFLLNGVKLGTWTSPGDFGEKRGILTPQWWTSNQYGLLKVLRISHLGVMLDGEHFSDIPLGQVITGHEQRWALRFEVASNRKLSGGLTLFGSKFGNHSQGILVRTFYKKL